MAAHTYRKGYLNLSLVSCPTMLHPATSSGRARFRQINQKIGWSTKKRESSLTTRNQALDAARRRRAPPVHCVCRAGAPAKLSGDQHGA